MTSLMDSMTVPEQAANNLLTKQLTIMKQHQVVLTKDELFDTFGGGDNCEMQKGRGPGYYVGFAVAWVIEALG